MIMIIVYENHIHPSMSKSFPNSFHERQTINENTRVSGGYNPIKEIRELFQPEAFKTHSCVRVYFHESA